MKTPSHITSHRFGLDARVWWVMLTLVVVSLGLVAYKKATDEPCIEFTIATKNFSANSSDQYYVGEDIRFTVSAPTAKNIVWNFGDSTESKKGNTIVTHSYLNDGKYNVTATINGRCQSITYVYVRKANISYGNNVTESESVAITGNETPQANSPSIYITNATANNYEWTILNRNDYKSQSGKMTVFNFKIPGRYTVQLKLDNDRQKIYTKNILVIPAAGTANNTNNNPLPTRRFDITVPPPSHSRSENPDTSNNRRTADPVVPHPVDPSPAERTIINASDKYLLRAFEEVIKGSKKIAEFEKYFCDGFATKVLINNRDYKSFEEFFNDIRNNDKRKVEQVETVRENNCIISIKVNVKKKGFLGRWGDL